MWTLVDLVHKQPRFKKKKNPIFDPFRSKAHEQGLSQWDLRQQHHLGLCQEYKLKLSKWGVGQSNQPSP